MHDQMQEDNSMEEQLYAPDNSCVSGIGQYDTNIGSGKNYATISAGEIWQLVQNPQSAPKEQARWFIPSSYCASDAREHAAQRERGKFHWLAADIDEGNPAMADVVKAVKETLPGTCFLIYSSRSATSDNRKWRVLVPLAVDASLQGDGYSAAQSAWFGMLEAKGLHLDRSLERPGQLIYLPNRGAHYDRHYEPGSPLGKEAPLWVEAQAKFHELRQAVASRKRKNDGPNSPVAAFRRKHSVTDMLAEYDYKQKGSGVNWRSLHQQSDGYATRDYGDYWISLSGSDRERGIGAPTANGHRFGDAFDLYVHYECGGDREKALEYAWQLWRQENGDLIEHGRKLSENMKGVGGRRILFRSPASIVLEERAEALRLPGLAGAIADLVYRAGDRDSRVYANAAGMMAMSALASPLYVLEVHPGERVSLNLYSLVVGPTSTGKENVRTAIRLALEAAGRGNEFLDGAPSFPALHEHLAVPTETQAPGTVTLALDEAGLNLKTINSTANGHQQLLINKLMSLFGLGFGKLTHHKVRDKAMRIPAVDRPRVSLLWTSTPGAFIEAVSAKDSESGQLNRFGTWWLADVPSLRQQRAERSLLQLELPEPVRSLCAKFEYKPSAEHHPARAPDEIIPTTADALVRIDAFVQEVEADHIQGVSDRHRQSWGRAVEYLKKYAGLIALADNPDNPQCEAKHVELAREIVLATVGATSEIADRSATKNVKPDSWEKVLAYIAEHKDADGWVSARDVKREALRYNEKRDEIVKDMVASGELEERKVGKSLQLRQMPDAA